MEYTRILVSVSPTEVPKMQKISKENKKKDSHKL
jgi:hypothetical protein